MNQDRVVLLHGIIRRASSMSPVESALRRKGYLTLNIDYPSTRHTLEEIAEIIHPAIEAFNADNPGALHFVTHSMGGLVTRVYLAANRPANLGKIVMMAPPNQGSEVADLLRRFGAYKRLMGPAGQQLATRAASKLPVPDCLVGVIAGTRSVYPFASFFLPGENDGRVSVKRTRITPDGPCIAVNAPHPTIMRHKGVHAAVEAFLATGAFPVEAITSPAAARSR